MGPFQRTVLASLIAAAKTSADFGPMSRPFHPSGMSTPSSWTSPVPDPPHPISPSGLRATTSTGRIIRSPASASSSLHSSTLVMSIKRRTGLVAQRVEERESHGATHHERRPPGREVT